MPITPSDHELLIIHSEQLHTMCNMMSDTKKTLNEFIVKIDKRCDTRQTEILQIQDSAMRVATFWKILTITVVIIMAMMGTMGYNRTISLRNEIRIESLTTLTEMNSQMLHQLLQKLASNRHEDLK